MVIRPIEKRNSLDLPRKAQDSGFTPKTGPFAPVLLEFACYRVDKSLF
jgi:hypothetical protein